MPRRILYTLLITACLLANGFSQVHDTTTAEKPVLVELSLNYLAPRSGEVYLVWRSENVPLDSAAGWIADTRRSDNLLYIPMELKEDTFRLTLLLPPATQLYFCFWINKNKEGHYQNIWDTRAGENLVMGEASRSIFKRANYEAPVELRGINALSYAWKLALVLLLFYLLLGGWWKRKTPRDQSSAANRIAAIGFSLALLHLPLRMEIIKMRPRQITSWELLERFLATAASDLLVVSGLTLLFLLAASLIRQRPRAGRVLTRVFFTLALFFLLFAVLNIDAVRHLGGPFTYQWLYYADFLQGSAAHTALMANASLLQAIQVTLYCLLLPLLAVVCQQAWRLTGGTKNSTYAFSTGLGSLLMLAGPLQPFTPIDAERGTTENAAWAFVASVIQTTRSADFFSQDLPPGEAFVGEVQNATTGNFDSLNQDRKVKNLVFIVLESAGAEYLDDYGGGYGITPNLRSHQEQALIFNDAYATAPASNRTLVSLTSSIYPYLSYRSLTEEAPEVDFPSLPAILKEHGYRTSFFSSADWNWQNSDRFLKHRGFDQVEDYTDIACAEQYRIDETIYPTGGGIDDGCIADRFSSWLGEVPDQAFASVLWTVQGHYPYYFAGKEIDYGVNNFTFNRYLNALRHDDELVGEVLDNLQARGLDSTTLVVLVGDHGEAFGQHGQTGHGGGVYEENLRVPLYFINPTLFHGTREDDLVTMKDVPATALSLLGIPIPPAWQGRDLLATDAHEVFSFAPWTGHYFGYRNRRFKYIFNEANHGIEVYDLVNDPGETNDLIARHPQDSIDFARLRIAAWAQHHRDFIANITQHE